MSADPNKVACAASPTPKANRKPSKYPWTADMDDQLRQVYRRSRNRRELSVELSRLASTLRRPKFILANRAQSLGLSLLPWKPWSKEEILTLRELAGQKGVRAIAKVMKRSYHSVKHQLFRMDRSAQLSEGYSIRQLQGLMGVSNPKIQMWLTTKTLKMKEERITEESVRKFLFTHMEAYSFRRCDEAWVKGMLNPNFGERMYASPQTTDEANRNGD
jgi:hypothetical protein